MRSSAPPALAACLKPRAWRLCALLGASAGRRMKVRRLALRGVSVAGGCGLLARAALTLSRGAALRRWRRPSPWSPPLRLARPALLPLLVLRLAEATVNGCCSGALLAARASPCALAGRVAAASVASAASCVLSPRRLAPFPPGVAHSAPAPLFPVAPVGALCGNLSGGTRGSLWAPLARSLRLAPRLASPLGLWSAPLAALCCAPSGPCRAVCAPAAPRAPRRLVRRCAPASSAARYGKEGGKACLALDGCQPRNSVLPACRATGPLRSDRRPWRRLCRSLGIKKCRTRVVSCMYDHRRVSGGGHRMPSGGISFPRAHGAHGSAALWRSRARAA